jgi:DNA-directed RNA polymerase subunit F
MSVTIVEERPISMSEAKEEVVKIEKRDKEVGLRTIKTKEYFDNFVKIKASEARDLRKKLEGLEIPRLKEEHIIKIIDLMPVTEDMLKAMMQGYIITINKDNMKKIVDTVKDFEKK